VERNAKKQILYARQNSGDGQASEEWKTRAKKEWWLTPFLAPPLLNLSTRGFVTAYRGTNKKRFTREWGHDLRLGVDPMFEKE